MLVNISFSLSVNPKEDDAFFKSNLLLRLGSTKLSRGRSCVIWTLRTQEVVVVHTTRTAALAALESRQLWLSTLSNCLSKRSLTIQLQCVLPCAQNCATGSSSNEL